MLIIDLNQIVLSNLFMALKNHVQVHTVEESMFRHMVLNSLRSIKQKFGVEGGEFVIACDNKNYWRKQLFPYYKASRKKAQEKSDIDWSHIFNMLNKIKAEIKDNFPYRVIEVESAEADDVIATLCRMEPLTPKTIISADKDFIQLHSLPNVTQYDPIHKKWIKHDDPQRYLLEHVIRGDVGDGIPNILSNDNCLVVGERQRPITKKRLEYYATHDQCEFEEVVLRNYYRNENLIDLRKIPADIQSKIKEEYILQSGKKRDKLMNYFIANRLKNLMEHMSEF